MEVMEGVTMQNESSMIGESMERRLLMSGEVSCYRRTPSFPGSFF